MAGLIYPMGTRLALQKSEATVISLHENGKYVLRLDGSRKQPLFEPSLANHVPAGVWSHSEGVIRAFKVALYGFCSASDHFGALTRGYSQGQMLMVFVDGHLAIELAQRHLRQMARPPSAQGEHLWQSARLGGRVRYDFSSMSPQNCM